MNVHIVFVAAAALALGGCATVAFNGPQMQTTKFDRPPIGQVVTANVGDPLVEKGEVVKEQVLQVNHIIDGVAYNIPQGIYVQVGHDAQNNYYSAVGVVPGAFVDPAVALRLAKTPGAKLCVVPPLGRSACYSGDYETKAIVSKHATSFQQTLIYSGRVGDKVHISYREFSDNMARPAFNNEVVYDLAVSHVIGYKGAQIDVIKADNNGITYKVLHNFP